MAVKYESVTSLDQATPPEDLEKEQQQEPEKDPLKGPAQFGQGMSVLTGDPEPYEGEDAEARRKVAAGMMRYGLPIAAGLGTGGLALAPSLLIGGAASATGEISARQLERAATDPEMGSLTEDFKAGGVAGALDMGVGLVTHGMGKALIAGAKRILTPRTLPDSVEIADSVLAGATAKKHAKDFYKFKGKEDPFGLTMGQLNRDEQGLAYHMESVARASFRGGRFKKFDERNLNKVQEEVQNYISKAATELSDVGFGRFVNTVLGKTSKSGELFKPAEALKARLYEKYHAHLAEMPGTIDGSRLRETLRKSKDPVMLNTYREAFETKMLPSLNDKEAWKQLSPVDVDNTIRSINRQYGSYMQDPTAKRRLDYMRRQIAKPFEKFVAGDPEVEKWRSLANAYNGKFKDTLHNATIIGMRKALENKPSTVVKMLDPKYGNPSQVYDNLMSLKKAFYFNDKARKAFGATGDASAKLYEKNILRPLRFKMFTQATDADGIFQPGKMLKRFEKIETSTPELLTELFGSPKQAQAVKNLFTTMEVVQKTRPKAFPHLKLGNIIGGGLGGFGVYQMINNDNPAVTTTFLGGGLTVLMAPAALAKAMTNPRLVRALTDGVKEDRIFTGIGPKMAVALRKIGQQKAASEIVNDSNSSDATQFYSFELYEDNPIEGDPLNE